MLFWGVFFIALGIGALLDVRLWPIALIGLGAAMVLSIGFGGRRSNAWLMPACCLPAAFRPSGLGRTRNTIVPGARREKTSYSLPTTTES